MYRQIFVLCLLSVFAGASLAEPEDGKSNSGQGVWEGEVEVEPVEDLFFPKFRLLSELRYRQSDGRIWVTPQGAVLDGRSVPKLFLGIFGPPLEANYRKSAVTYDYSVQSKHHPWKVAQSMFYEGVLSEGVAAIDAKVMFMLLRATGSRWAVQSPSNCFSRCHGPGARLEWRPRVNDSDVVKLVDWVRSNNPSLEEIEHEVHAVIIEEGPHSNIPIR